jgi:hypothetical protein
MTKPLEKPAGPVVLSTGAIIDGVYFAAGQTLPYTAEHEVPENLRPHILTDADELPVPVVRNVYAHMQTPEQQRAVQECRGNIQLQTDWAEDAAIAEAKLPPETEAVLRDTAERNAALEKAKLKAKQDAVDNAYEAAAQHAEEVQTQYFVRRGGAWGKVQNCQLRPGETCFVKRENGEYEASGFIDSTGSPPPPEIIP